MFWPALGVAAFLMFVARPLAVVACLLPFRYRLAEIGFISWTGLRGAVGIFLASIPLLAGLPNAQLYFNVAFVVVFASLVVQGWTLSRAAHLFGVAVPRADPNTRRIQLDLPGQLEYDMVGYRIAAGSAALRGAPCPAACAWRWWCAKAACCCPRKPARLPPTTTATSSRRAGRRRGWTGCSPKAAMRARPSRTLFGSFTLPGDVPLGELAKFYGLQHPGALRRMRPRRTCSTSASTNRRRSATGSRSARRCWWCAA